MRLKVGTKFASMSVLGLCLMLIAIALGMLELERLSYNSLRLAGSAEASQHASALQSNLQELYSGLDSATGQHYLDWLDKPLQIRLSNVSHSVTQLSRVLDERGAHQRVRELTEIHATLTSEVDRLVELARDRQWNAASLRFVNYISPIKANFEAQTALVEQELQRDMEAVTSVVLRTRSSYRRMVLIETLLALALLSLVSWLLWRNLVEPIRGLTQSAMLLAGGNLDARSNIGKRGDEIGALAATFDSMAEQLAASHRSLEEKVEQRTAEIEAQRAALQHLLTDLQATTAEREELLTALAQLQNPVIPVIEGVVVAPIVGHLTDCRFDRLQQSLLDTVVATQARVALLDITGVARLDEASAARLLGIGQALRLLGATAILVGIRPEVA
ncbi:MAG TPA: HAMP domain-containing protein, partial [Herpetosiphonaceae bacterium]